MLAWPKRFASQFTTFNKTRAHANVERAREQTLNRRLAVRGGVESPARTRSRRNGALRCDTDGGGGVFFLRRQRRRRRGRLRTRQIGDGGGGGGNSGAHIEL